MIKKITKYISDIDGKDHEFVSKQKAIEFENKFNSEKDFNEKMDVFLRYFPKYPRDGQDRYQGKCVDCEKILYQFDTEYDGYDARVGKLLWEKPSKRFLSGLRCPHCHEKAVELFEKMLKFKYKGIQISTFIFSPEQFEKLPEEDNFVLKNLLDIVDNWDNKKHREPYKLNKKDGAKKCRTTKSKN